MCRVVFSTATAVCLAPMSGIDGRDFIPCIENRVNRERGSQDVDGFDDGFVERLATQEAARNALSLLESFMIVGDNMVCSNCAG